jgi:hypothetical protein
MEIKEPAFNTDCNTKDNGIMRSFSTGATRDTGDGKLDYEGFLSPDSLRQFAKFMNMHRLQSDGTLRDSDNWQKGIPTDVYMKSMYRHFMEFWAGHRNKEVHCDRQEQVEWIGALCGILFNAMGYLHEFLKENAPIDFDGEEPITEIRERKESIDNASKQQQEEQAYNKQILEDFRNHFPIASILRSISPELVKTVPPCATCNDENGEPCVCDTCEKKAECDTYDCTDCEYTGCPERGKCVPKFQCLKCNSYYCPAKKESM